MIRGAELRSRRPASLRSLKFKAHHPALYQNSVRRRIATDDDAHFYATVRDAADHSERLLIVFNFQSQPAQVNVDLGAVDGSKFTRRGRCVGCTGSRWQPCKSICRPTDIASLQYPGRTHGNKRPATAAACQEHFLMGECMTRIRTQIFAVIARACRRRNAYAPLQSDKTPNTGRSGSRSLFRTA